MTSTIAIPSSIRRPLQREKIRPRTLDASKKNLGTARTLALFTIFFVCSAGPIVALGPTSHISQYGHSVWRVRDGYFGGMPMTITQTTDGYIWVGTEAGLYQFGGVRFLTGVRLGYG